jgi:hypothetical protein
MRRFGAIEVGLLILAAFLICCGAYAAIRPEPLIMSHNSIGAPAGIRVSSSEEVSRTKARIYGVASTVFGVGIAIAVCHRPNRR